MRIHHLNYNNQNIYIIRKKTSRQLDFVCVYCHSLSFLHYDDAYNKMLKKYKQTDCFLLSICLKKRKKKKTAHDKYLQLD